MAVHCSVVLGLRLLLPFLLLGHLHSFFHAPRLAGTSFNHVFTEQFLLIQSVSFQAPLLTLLLAWKVLKHVEVSFLAGQRGWVVPLEVVSLPSDHCFCLENYFWRSIHHRENRHLLQFVKRVYTRDSCNWLLRLSSLRRYKQSSLLFLTYVCRDYLGFFWWVRRRYLVGHKSLVVLLGVQQLLFTVLWNSTVVISTIARAAIISLPAVDVGVTSDLVSMELQKRLTAWHNLLVVHFSHFNQRLVRIVQSHESVILGLLFL